MRQGGLEAKRRGTAAGVDSSVAALPQNDTFTCHSERTRRVYACTKETSWDAVGRVGNEKAQSSSQRRFFGRCPFAAPSLRSGLWLTRASAHQNDRSAGGYPQTPIVRVGVRSPT